MYNLNIGLQSKLAKENNQGLFALESIKELIEFFKDLKTLKTEYYKERIKDIESLIEMYKKHDTNKQNLIQINIEMCNKYKNELVLYVKNNINNCSLISISVLEKFGKEELRKSLKCLIDALVKINISSISENMNNMLNKLVRDKLCDITKEKLIELFISHSKENMELILKIDNEIN